MTSSVKSQPSSPYLIDLRQGKPNTKIPLKQSDGSDPRPFLVQLPQKGPNCSFYSLNMLRKRIGPTPCPELVEARRIEKACSDFYKSFRSFEWDTEHSVPFLIDLMKGWAAQNSLPLNKLPAEIPNLISVMIANSEEVKKTCNFESMLPLLIEFSKQTTITDLGPFLKERRQVIKEKMCQTLFSAINISPEEIYRMHLLDEAERKLKDSLPPNMIKIQEQVFSPKVTSDLIKKLADGFFVEQPCEKALRGNAVLQNGTVFFSAAKALGFRVADWDPTQTIESLETVLKTKGAVVVGGLYSTKRYKNAPYKVKEVNGKPIYGWKPGDRLPLNREQILSGHCIVVMGVEKGGSKGGYVYYTDPHDGSSPTDPLKQRIYIISYESFIQSLSNLIGYHFVTPRKSAIGYALYYAG